MFNHQHKSDALVPWVITMVAFLLCGLLYLTPNLLGPEFSKSAMRPMLDDPTGRMCELVIVEGSEFQGATEDEVFAYAMANPDARNVSISRDVCGSAPRN